MHRNPIPPALHVRQDLRFDVAHATSAARCAPAEGILRLRLTDLSRLGCGARLSGEAALARGERLILRLPLIGAVDCFAVWCERGRAGFQFEKPLAPAQFVALLGALGGHGLPRLERRKVRRAA